VAGGNDTPEKLWQSLLDRKDASGEIPAMRWEPYYRRDARNSKELAKTTSRGYFLDRLEDFDAQFFGISPKEAEQMDPQQRISLEVAWEALENAGIPPQSLSGSDTAVFWGVNSDDYSKLLLEDLPNIEAWMGIGTAYCGVPNRISYHLNLMGPSTAVDAACASGLVAIHHGRQAILQGESTVAIVGGVNALGGPGLTRVLDKAGAVSPEGRCRSFDESAHGYGRGEGAGAIVLKRLSQAIIDHDHILAVLKGSAVAQDGKTNGIMAPNAKAQELVAQKALDVAGIDPLTVQYVEAHATSTPLGDPTEVSAIATIYGSGRPANEPCLIGSIKPNIGHLEAGAGTMGFIKAVLAVQKGVIPPQANLTKLNSKINWSESGVRVVQEATEWPFSGLPRRASVCSYGYGGTVSHAVIEEFIVPTPQSSQTPHVSESGPFHLLLSGPQEKRLAVEAESLRAWLEGNGRQHPFSDVVATLATRRGHHDYRAALVVDDAEDAIALLTSLAKVSNSPLISKSRILPKDIRKEVVWVFSGHGAQWAGMGKELVRHPVFLQATAVIDEISQAEIGFSPLELLRTGQFESSDQVQVMTYLMQVGISEILHEKGLHPQAIIGHSVGEIAASVVAGALTVEDGALIVTRRAKLYREVMGLGGMILVNQPFDVVQKELRANNYGSDIVAAIDSSPSSCVVAGPTDALTVIENDFKARGIKTFTVKTDIAFHSPMLSQLVQPLLDSLSAALEPMEPDVQLYSTSLPHPRRADPRGPQYWADNMVNPVLLKPAVDAALEDGYRVFLEISAHPLVSHSITETLLDRGIDEYGVIPTMLRNKPAIKNIMHSIGQLHTKGVSIDWLKQIRSRSWASAVPSVKWIHKPSWRHVQTPPLAGTQNHDVDKHTLLGQRTPVAGTDVVVYSTYLDSETKPFPGSHPLHGTEIVPAAGLINTFIHGVGTRTLKNIVLRVPVSINAPRQVQLIVQSKEVKLVSRLLPSEQQSNGQAESLLSWTTHTTAVLEKESPPEGASLRMDIEAIKLRIGEKLADDFSIKYLDQVGVSAMGFPWAVTEHYANTKEMIARVDVAPSILDGTALPWDPQSWAPILDAATSVGSTIFYNEPRLRMPAQIERVDIFSDQNPPKYGWLYVQEASDTALAVHVTVLNNAGLPLAKFTSMRFSEIQGTPGVSGSMESLVHQMAWPPAPLAEQPLLLTNIIFVADENSQAVTEYASSLPTNFPWEKVASAQALVDQASTLPLRKGSAIIYIPADVKSEDDIMSCVQSYASTLLKLVKIVVGSALTSKVFVLTRDAAQARTRTALAHGALFGLSRIIASEHPDHFGGLFDTETGTIPFTFLKYVQGADVVRIDDGVARTARLRNLPRHKLRPASEAKDNLLPRPDGTYLITGGVGALGLAVADFLVEHGARRLVLISRRSLPARKSWDQLDGLSSDYHTIAQIRSMEARGASVHVVSMDISAAEAADNLCATLDRLSLPQVRGVVHAAGVLDNQLVMETTDEAFERVLAPKIHGAMVLHEVFPPTSLDFFLLFSSCGQLFGFPGQSSYASGNAFLDSLATHRRALGDNAVSFQWTTWRGMGMGASTDFINAEMESKGITDVTREEAFGAWQHLARFDLDHGVILRSLAFEEGEPLPVPILNDIAVRRARAQAVEARPDTSAERHHMPTSGPELRRYLEDAIRTTVANILQANAGDVDPKAALSDLGIDSVMTVSLRRELQQTLKVKVPPTLTWSHPTVAHLVPWFAERIEGQ
jgi:6-methylsalicylic acid synthase